MKKRRINKKYLKIEIAILSVLILILIGYIVGITAKFINPDYMANIDKLWYVVTIYIINFIMVFTDLMLYIRNYKLDKKNNS